MRTWPDGSFALMRLYVEEREFGRSHVSVLRRFQLYVMSKTSSRSLSVEAISDWLRQIVRAASLKQAVRRAQLVTRFLDWLVEQRALESNPFRELRQEYCRRQSTAGVVRALVTENPPAALAALGTLPAYGSHLGSVIRSHVERMRQLGCRYKADRFLRFDRFLQQRQGATKCPAHRLVQEYAESAQTASGHLERLKVGRMILDSLRRHGEPVEMPRRDRLIVAAMLRERCRPYIFTQEEIQELLAAALSFSSPKAPLRPLTLYTMLVLAYCAGLRMGEIVHLVIGDVRLEEGLIEIRDTKFFKSRRLPLTSSVVEALRAYLRARMLAGANTALDSPLFWHDKNGYAYITANHLLRRVLRKAGLKPKAGRVGPRIHDLRHTFVVHRMLAWYREGVDVQARLPYLWTYLGHRDLHSTIVYLTVTQELLQEASKRFRKLGAGLLQGNGGLA
jgi:site-specific recombinase XerD